jgi:hypothetical protein
MVPEVLAALPISSMKNVFGASTITKDISYVGKVIRNMADP